MRHGGPTGGADGADCQRRVVGALDAVGVGVALLDASGRFLHRNAALVEAIRSPGGAELEESLSRLASGLCAQVLPGVPWEIPPEDLACEEVRTGAGWHRLTARPVEPGVVGPEAALLVTLLPLSPASPADGALRSRFGLSRREVRIAQLLAEGHSNAEIAAALHLSVHTVRNHVQRVLRKLGAQSRAQVGPRISR